jgi:hypothetical protein
LLFCIFNVYFNAVRMVKNGANSPDGSLLPSIQKPGFRFCHECQMNSPPRSFHCPGLYLRIFSYQSFKFAIFAFCVETTTVHLLENVLGTSIKFFFQTLFLLKFYFQRYFMASICNLWPVTFACFM